ncbi:MAG: hypothetical protein JW739_05300 [Opitutales bacterium]|nr:hypothetical protein [Opitutales bacterium]
MKPTTLTSSKQSLCGRAAPGVVLFFMSPFIAEFLLGDFSIDAIGLLFFMAPLYGGGALVVRETARRLNRGWPTIMLLALAYGLFEEGIVIGTLFNPNYLGLHLLENAYIPALGIGAFWTTFVLTIHTVWSISVPIAITEGLFKKRKTEPWLNNTGLGIAVLFLILGGILIRSMTRMQDSFQIPLHDQIAVWVLIAVVATVAIRIKPKQRPEKGASINPVIVLTGSFLFGIAVLNTYRLFSDWPLAIVLITIDITGFTLLAIMSRRSRWTTLQTTAAAGGAMFAYACMAFPQEPVAGTKGVVDLAGNAIFAAIALCVFLLALKQIAKAHGAQVR